MSDKSNNRLHDIHTEQDKENLSSKTVETTRLVQHKHTELAFSPAALNTAKKCYVSVRRNSSKWGSREIQKGGEGGEEEEGGVWGGYESQALPEAWRGTSLFRAAL